MVAVFALSLALSTILRIALYASKIGWRGATSSDAVQVFASGLAKTQ